MNRLFMLMVLLLSVLICGTSFADDITGTYKNKKKGSVLIVEKSGKDYNVTVKSKEEECSVQSKSELKKSKSGKNMLVFITDFGFSEWDVTIEKKNEINIWTRSRLCGEHVDGTYKK